MPQRRLGTPDADVETSCVEVAKSLVDQPAPSTAIDQQETEDSTENSYFTPPADLATVPAVEILRASLSDALRMTVWQSKSYGTILAAQPPPGASLTFSFIVLFTCVFVIL